MHGNNPRQPPGSQPGAKGEGLGQGTGKVPGIARALGDRGSRGWGGEGGTPVQLTQCAKLQSGAGTMQQETGGNDIWNQGIAETPHLYNSPERFFSENISKETF